MNYPSILTNQRNRIKTSKVDNSRESPIQRKTLISPSLPNKRPISTDAAQRAERLSKDPYYVDNLASKLGKQNAIQAARQCLEIIEENKKMGVNSKLSAGTLSTFTHEEKKAMVEQLNKKCEEYAPLKPISSFLGPKVDPLNCRKVKQLDDIEFEDDESNEDEDTYKDKRLPRNIITESTLKNYLTPGLTGLNIERHTWIRNGFLSKVGAAAPNLQVNALLYIIG